MPKKFGGGNEKAIAAREAKDSKKQAEAAKARKAAEDAAWQDDDKAAARKAERKAEAEAKKRAEAQRKAENRELAAQDATTSVPKDKPNERVSRAELERRRQLAALKAARGIQEEQERETKQADWDLDYNPNHRARERAEAAAEAGIDVVEVSGVEGAIAALGGASLSEGKNVNRKAAYKAFEERMTPLIRGENPKLKRTQIQERIFRMWQSSPDNPDNQ